jgi:putative spermidine/putrescine transport system ATP-binding protein
MGGQVRAVSPGVPGGGPQRPSPRFGGELRFDRISKRFGATSALEDISLTVPDGAFCTLLGPSGCGKTTLLRIAAGFVDPDAGSVSLGGRDLADIPPSRRNMGFVFQSYALFPTKTVAENIAFPLSVRGAAVATIAERVAELCALAGLEGLEARYPHEISGGQQQRVALARALAADPPVLLLDEPLAALDARIRERLRVEVRRIVDEIGVTAIYVTHDQDEAIAIADQIVVMDRGVIRQTGRPEDVYLAPVHGFVARFVGASSRLDCTVLDARRIRIGGEVLDAAIKTVPGPADLFLRPEDVVIGAGGVAAMVERAAFRGPVWRLTLRLADGQTLEAEAPTPRWREAPIAPGTQVSWSAPAARLHVFSPEGGGGAP